MKGKRMNEDILVVSKLAKSYGENQAVRGITFSIPKGEIFGLLGPNGAGKSTTISMLAGLVPPTSGMISIKGMDLSRNLAAAKAHIGLVPQEIALYPTLSAWDNLVFWVKLTPIAAAACPGMKRIGTIRL